MPLAVRCPARRRATALVVAASLLVVLAAPGCPTATPLEEDQRNGSTKAPPVVRLLVVDDQALAAAIEREWNASGRGELQLAELTPSELAGAKRLAADVVIYPAAMLGDLAERRLITPLPNSLMEDPEFASADLFALLRRRECTWGEKVYAVPFGSPQLLLVYRKDVFDEQKLKPPASWGDYEQILAMKYDHGFADSPLRTGAAEPLADGWGAKLLLARAAAYVRHPNQYSALFDYQTMKPLIAEPPFVRALEELVAAQKHAPDEKPKTALECEQAMIEGRFIMAITWPTRHADWNDVPPAMFGAELGCAELPGATPTYNFETKEWIVAAGPSRVPLLGVSGRLGSITTSARHTRAAADALLWLAGKEKGPLVAAQSAACTLSRSSQLPQASRFVSERYDASFAGEYGAALEDANERTLSLEMPRIPGHDAYLAPLDVAVQQAVAGKKPPADALAEAAEKWREITQQLGLETQRSAYMRSLGLEP